MNNINNVVIYMSDSIRWDYTPDEISDMGVSVKTIASSPHTPTSLASMVSGLWLPQHGVRGFTDTLTERVDTILDEFPNKGLSNVGGELNDRMLGEFFNDTIYNYLFDRYPRLSLNNIEEPFCWFMRDPGGHAPYGNWDEDMNALVSVPDFYSEHAGDTKYLREKYQEGLESSVERFRKYVTSPLKERDILDETLIIFLSDHGELLGEYGHISQSYPISPEIVYVPTVFIHPDIDSTDAEIMSHVDLPNTICDLADIDRLSQSDGHSVFSNNYEREHGYCLYNRPFPSFFGEFSYKVDSMWDEDGGHVFVRSNAWSNTKLLMGYLARISAGKHLRRKRNLRGIKLLFSEHEKWGKPGFSKSEADEKLQDINAESIESVTKSMDQDTEERLKDLGYL
jgi:hypothetical protein